MRYLYGVMCILGTLLPYGAFMPWLIQHGLDVPQLVLAATINPISIFAWLDVIIAALVTIAFVWVEGHRLHMRFLWLPIVATLTVGVSLGLPLFLLLREATTLRSAQNDNALGL